MNKSVLITMATLLVSGSFANGALAAPESKCKTCHSFEKDGGNKMGPNLFGIVGKKAGSSEGYKYGDFLSSADFTWDEENLKAWLEDSKGVAKAGGGSKMPSQKLKGKKADDVIAFLSSLK